MFHVATRRPTLGAVADEDEAERRGDGGSRECRCRCESTGTSSIVLYCIVSIHLYSASCSAHQSEALPVRETQREESSLERTKRGRDGRSRATSCPLVRKQPPKVSHEECFARRTLY